MSAFHQQNQMNIPYQHPMMPQSIGNMVNMGTGYNQPPNQMMGMGQYYGGMHTGLYNPYLAQQRQRQMEAQMRQAQIQNANQFKEVSKRVNKALGLHKDDMEEHLKQYDPQFIQEQRMTDDQREDQNTMRLMSIRTMNEQYPIQQQNQYTNMCRERERMDNQLGDCGLSDFFESYGEEAIRLNEQQLRMQQRQLNNLYNREAYNKLLNMHNQSNYFGSIYNKNNTMQNTSIDDMEIAPPASIQEQLQRKKMAFLNSIPRG
jgi:hypothetical protein